MNRQPRGAADYGPGWRASGYVFTNLNGDPMAPDRLSRTFKKLAAEAGLPPIRLHDLRHGAATLALAAGVDLRTVQDQLGHSSIVLTADTYIKARELHQGSEICVFCLARQARPAASHGSCRSAVTRSYAATSQASA